MCCLRLRFGAYPAARSAAPTRRTGTRFAIFFVPFVRFVSLRASKPSARNRVSANNVGP